MRDRIIQICFEAADKFFNFDKSSLQKFEICEKNEKCALFIKENEHLDEDIILNKVASKFSIRLVILSSDREKKEYGQGLDFFILIKNDDIFYHTNAAKVSKLPAGVGKLSNPRHRFDDIMMHLFKRKIKCRTCPLSSNCDFKSLEQKFGIRIEVWSKTCSKNGSIKIQGLRKSKRSKKYPLVRLHYDLTTQRYFLIQDSSLYFRGFLRKLNKGLLISKGAKES